MTSLHRLCGTDGDDLGELPGGNLEESEYAGIWEVEPI